MQTADSWIRDMPWQFQEKPRIAVLVKAFARQIQEIQKVFGDLDTELDLDRATGQNLDYLGTVIPLSRKEAGELAGIRSDETVMPDERYRQFLRYKNLADTSECTYYDMVAGIEMLWKYENIHYLEDPAHPATVIFKTPRMMLDQEDPVEFRPALCIRASGVGVILKKWYGDSFHVDVGSHVFGIRFNISFYPRFGCQWLHLDALWKLDGSRKLNGYSGEDPGDLYPVSMGIQAGIREDARAGPRTRLPSGAGQDLGNAQRVAVRTEAGQEPSAEQRVRVQVSAVQDSRAGGITIHNWSFLDGTWWLAGKRKLTGGTDWR